MSIKVTVDFFNGCYNITGIRNGNIVSIHKPIRGIDWDAYYKENYNLRLTRDRMKKIEYIAEKLAMEDPQFNFSKNALKNIDCTMYKALEDWDRKAGSNSNYATKYLKAVLQNYKNNVSNNFLNLFKNQQKDARSAHLRKLGIDVSYNVGLFTENKSMSLLDKIKGIFLATKQKHFIGAKVTNNLFVKDAKYINDKNINYSDFPDDLEDKIIEQTSKQFELNDNLDINTSSKNLNSIKFFDYEKMKSEKVESKIHLYDEKAIKAKNVLEKINAELSQLVEDDKSNSSNNKTSSSKSKEVETKKHYHSKRSHWTRKLHNLKDSIKNKKFIPNKLRKIAIRGAVTLFAIGGVAFSTSHFGKIHDFFGKNNDNKYKTEFTSSDKDKADDIVIFEPETETEFATDKVSEVETEKQSEKISETEMEEQTEKLSETETEVQTEKLPETETEVQTEKLPETETEVQTEKLSETETEVQTEKASGTGMEEQTEKTSVAQIKKQNKKISETETEKETELKAETKQSIKKNNIKQFKKEAIQKYMDAFVVGEKPAVGNLFKDQVFTSDPEGTGTTGHFDNIPNYEVGKIYVITNEDWNPVTVDGKSLPEALSEYPDYIDYSVLFVDKDTGNNLGYVTQSKLETLIKNKVNNIVKNKKAKKANTKKSETKKATQIADQDYER